MGLQRVRHDWATFTFTLHILNWRMKLEINEEILTSLVIESESCSVVSDSFLPHGLYSPWNSPGQDTGVGRLSFLQGIFPTQGLNPGLPHCRGLPLFPAEPPGNPKNTGVGSLSLLHGIFPTQELYQGLPHYRQIFNQLNHKGRPQTNIWYHLYVESNIL